MQFTHTSSFPAQAGHCVHLTAATDCGISSSKKACKDCTCGRADGKFEKVDLTAEMLENPQTGGCNSVSYQIEPLSV